MFLTTPKSPTPKSPFPQLEVYEELAAIFSQDNNEETHRDVLMREGTAKFAVTTRDTDRHLSKVLQRQNMSTSHGTIPYLGIFLTDLAMIDAAIPDRLPGNPTYINFDKKRKEFELLAQIKLLQGAAKAYRLAEDPMFDRWFASSPVLNDTQAHERSCVLEPPEPKATDAVSALGSTGSASAAQPTTVSSASKASSKSSSSLVVGHRKSASIASNSSSSNAEYGGNELKVPAGGNVTNGSRNNSLDRQSVAPNESSILSATSSMSSLSLESSASCSTAAGNDTQLQQQQQRNRQQRAATLPGNGISTIAPSIVNGQLHLTAADNDQLVIRVSLQTELTEADGLLQYKSMMLYNSDRTSQVIRNAIMKLDLAGDPDQWQLVYCLPDHQMLIQPNTNVFYAVDRDVSVNFMLRSKRSGKWEENLI